MLIREFAALAHEVFVVIVSHCSSKPGLLATSPHSHQANEGVSLVAVWRTALWLTWPMRLGALCEGCLAIMQYLNPFQAHWTQVGRPPGTRRAIPESDKPHNSPSSLP